MTEYLFRGVSAEMHNRDQGRLIPKGENVEVTISRGDHDPDNNVVFLRDGTLSRIPSETNAVRAHQIQSGMHDGAFISLSRTLKCASHFATQGGIRPGVVYVINPELFEEYGVVPRFFDNPRYPEEQEVSIRDNDGSEISNNIIIKTIEIPQSKA
ncbi:hypothetical protein [Moritella sp. 28]|uniref:hypothetical protein n=1 Tax=Moritella sp. 28 TaxID=2746232 RepID=UPI001BABF87C|nr:hypothetical protein [Moritella sp. 28]QUM85458.1 hypothetical protein HWV02_13560 [Moritella sp. 28]